MRAHVLGASPALPGRLDWTGPGPSDPPVGRPMLAAIALVFVALGLAAVPALPGGRHCPAGAVRAGGAGALGGSRGGAGQRPRRAATSHPPGRGPEHMAWGRRRWSRASKRRRRGGPPRPPAGLAATVSPSGSLRVTLGHAGPRALEGSFAPRSLSTGGPAQALQVSSSSAMAALSNRYPSSTWYQVGALRPRTGLHRPQGPPGPPVASS